MKFIYVTSYGSVYRLRPTQWKAYVEHKAHADTGFALDISHFGVNLGPVTDVTEWKAEDARREQFEVRQAS